MSEIKQGVTLEVMGEGTSMGPLSDEMKQHARYPSSLHADIKYDIEWTTLGEYLEFLERKGVAANVASFVGSATLRIHAAGYDDRASQRQRSGGDENACSMRRCARARWACPPP